MDSRNWADLNSDCLITIFSKVGDTRSLIESVQFVCKSWLRASLDPLCLETLTFSVRCPGNFVKYAVDRSQGCATTVMFKFTFHSSSKKNKIKFPFPLERLCYLGDGCPLLKVLVFEQSVYGMSRADQDLLCSSMFKLKNLEKFKLQSCNFISYLVETIGVNCKKIVELDCSLTEFHERDIEAIVRYLPQLKSLNMSWSRLCRPQLIAILTTCKDLEFLDVSYCWGFNPDDEIYRLASYIKVFNCNGCKELKYDYNEYDSDEYNDYNEYDYEDYDDYDGYY